jgi:hypothetical protein
MLLDQQLTVDHIGVVAEVTSLLLSRHFCDGTVGGHVVLGGVRKKIRNPLGKS